MAKTVFSDPQCGDTLQDERWSSDRVANAYTSRVSACQVLKQLKHQKR
jgi:hypothetical protein